MPKGGPRLRGADGESNLIGARVRKKREAMGLFRDQFAARLAAETTGLWNPSVDELYNLEARIRTITDYEVRVLARVLNCTVAWLFEEEPSPSNSNADSGT